MSIDQVKHRIREHAAAGEIREQTGTLTYDLTYADLCSAGAGLRHAIESHDQALAAYHTRHLMLGLVAWNLTVRCPRHSGVPLAQIALGARPNAALELINAVMVYEDCESDGAASPPIQDAMRVVGVDTKVTIASKLLHFLSPAYLPMFDRRVRQALALPASTPRQEQIQYNEYAGAVRGLGLTGHRPEGLDEDVAAFGGNTTAPESRLRRLDCTLWFRRAPARLSP